MPVEEKAPFATFNTIPSPGLFENLPLSSPSEDVTSEQLPLLATERSDAGVARAQMLESDIRERINAMSVSQRMQDTSSAMNLAVGGTLVPAPLEELPVTRRQFTRQGPELRLPSFELLGIAASSHQMSLDGRLNYLANNDASHHCKTSPLMAPVTLPGDVVRPTLPATDVNPAAKCVLLDVLTPPADSGDISWNIPPVVVMSAPIDSPGTSPDLQLGLLADDAEPDRSLASSTAHPVGSSDEDTVDQIGSGLEEISTFHAAPAWVRPAVHKLCRSSD
jgi:hypothetical protein